MGESAGVRLEWACSGVAAFDGVMMRFCSSLLMCGEVVVRRGRWSYLGFFGNGERGNNDIVLRTTVFRPQGGAVPDGPERTLSIRVLRIVDDSSYDEIRMRDPLS